MGFGQSPEHACRGFFFRILLGYLASNDWYIYKLVVIGSKHTTLVHWNILLQVQILRSVRPFLFMFPIADKWMEGATGTTTSTKGSLSFPLLE